MERQQRDEALRAEIEALLDERVRPMLQAHAGDLAVTDLTGGVLRFRFRGQCSGCPSAWLTVEEVVKAPLMEAFPALRDVVVDNDADEELVRLARDVLSGKRKLE